MWSVHYNNPKQKNAKLWLIQVNLYTNIPRSYLAFLTDCNRSKWLFTIHFLIASSFTFYRAFPSRKVELFYVAATLQKNCSTAVSFF